MKKSITLTTSLTTDLSRNERSAVVMPPALARVLETMKGFRLYTFGFYPAHRRMVFDQQNYRRRFANTSSYFPGILGIGKRSFL